MVTGLYEAMMNLTQNIGEFRGFEAALLPSFPKNRNNLLISP
jgi:hypothetical protein